MRILSIDTSCAMASVAITIDERIVAESLLATERTLSARLVPEIERLLLLAGLAMADIDLFAAAIGPGSFTGVRAGVATVQGLALATAKPCIGFSTLAMLALNFPLSRLPVCALLDARKSEVYAGLYDCSAPIPRPLMPDCVMPPLQFAELVRKQCTGPVILAGEGAVRYGDVFAAVLGSDALVAPFPHNCGHAANGALLARDGFAAGRALNDPSQLLPVYIRPSEAELAAQRR